VAVRGVDVVAQEVDLLADLAVLGVLLAVQDVVFGYGIILLRHQGGLHLVLDLLNGDAVGHTDPAQDAVEVLVGGVESRSEKGLADGHFDFFKREGFQFAIPFG
jgi:hypothetical protein